MSKDTRQVGGSPHKHKGMKTSLHINEQNTFQQGSNIYTNPHRVYVQTTTEQPNVMPYIDSQYTTKAPIVSQTHSEYVPTFQRQNNLINDPKQPAIINVTKPSHSPLQSGKTLNLSKSKFEAVDQNRYNTSGSTFIPPPPQWFQINSSSVPQRMGPDLSNTLINVRPPIFTGSQSIKKTFVPHHIINEIPVYEGGIQHGENTYQQDGQEESQEVLMGYYEKLYAKYEAERQRNQILGQQLSSAHSEINLLKSQLQNLQVGYGSVANQGGRKKVVSRQRLQELILGKFSDKIDQVINKQKVLDVETLKQISSMFDFTQVTLTQKSA